MLQKLKQQILEHAQLNINNYFKKFKNQTYNIYVQNQDYDFFKDTINQLNYKNIIIIKKDFSFSQDEKSNEINLIFVINFFLITDFYKSISENNQCFNIYEDLRYEFNIINNSIFENLWLNIDMLVNNLKTSQIKKIENKHFISYIDLFKELLLETKYIKINKKNIAIIHSDSYYDTLGTINKKLNNCITFSDSNTHIKKKYFYGTEFIRFYTFLDIVFSTNTIKVSPNSVYINLHHALIPTYATVIKDKKSFFYYNNKERSPAKFNLISSKILKTKNSIYVGYPKLDTFIDYYKKNRKYTDDIIIATSIINFEYKKYSAVVHDPSFITNIVTTYNKNKVYFRPHPGVFTHPKILKIVKDNSIYNNFKFHTNSSYMKTFSEISIYISDGLGSSCYTYAFATLKPVIFYMPKYDIYFKNYKELEHLRYLNIIGDITTTQDELLAMIEKYKNDFDYIQQKSYLIKKLRNENILNIGNSSKVIVKFLKKYIKFESNIRLIQHYKKQFETYEKNLIKSKIYEFFEDLKNKKIAIYGAGEHYTKVFKQIFNFSKLNIVCFFDSNKTLLGKKIDNIEVKDINKFKKFDIILISSKKFDQEIKNDLQKISLDSISLYDIIDKSIDIFNHKIDQNKILNLQKIESSLKKNEIDMIINKNFTNYYELLFFAQFYKKKLFSYTKDQTDFYLKNKFLNIEKTIVDTPKISVILPVYNKANHLIQSIDSIIHQDLNDIEIIIIDDNSTDNSLFIINQYKDFDSRIKVIFNKKNLGVASTRNIALKKARGEYIAFLDADDFFPSNDVLSSLYKNAITNNADACGGNIEVLNQYTLKSAPYPHVNFSISESINFEDYPCSEGFTRFIYRNSIIQKYNILFPNFIFREDPIFFVTFMLKAKKIFVINKNTYTYRVNHKTKVFTEKSIEDILSSYLINLKMFSEHILYKHYDFELNLFNKNKDLYLQSENIEKLNSFLKCELDLT